MALRTFQAGDEAVQVAIYNEAAADLPRFKPAQAAEIRRRTQAADFDPAARFFSLHRGRPVGYASFHANGRVSFPWCLPGYEDHAEPLFTALLEAMTARHLPRASAAYRGDWPVVEKFFLAHGFRRARDMIDFVVELVDMPTPAEKALLAMTPLRSQDIPAVFALAPHVLRVRSPDDLEKHLLHNPYFSSDAVFLLRSRDEDRTVLAAGILVEKPPYADPRQVDADMPCFRLGAFGTEGMQTKRINGLFSFLAGSEREVSPLALNLLGHAAYRLRNANVGTLAAQVPSDAPQLLSFYQQHFHRQGSFPVYERELGN